MAPKHAHAHDTEGKATNNPAESAPAQPRSIKLLISGFPLTLPVPYSEGHVLTAVEANVLNQTYAENIRNNQAGVVKKALETGGGVLTDEAQVALSTAILAYAESYTFAGPRAPRVSVDPVEHEARKLAKADILAALAKAGKTSKDYTKEFLEGKVTELLEKKPSYRKVAQERITALANIATEGLEDLLA